MSLNSKISKTNSTLPCSQIMHYSCIPVLQPFSLLKPRLILCLVNKLNLNLVQYHTPFRANSFLFSLVMVGLRLDIAVSVTPGTSQRKQARQHKYNTDNLHGKKKKRRSTLARNSLSSMHYCKSVNTEGKRFRQQVYDWNYNCLNRQQENVLKTDTQETCWRYCHLLEIKDCLQRVAIISLVFADQSSNC